jgi:hypothetical protein
MKHTLAVLFAFTSLSALATSTNLSSKVSGEYECYNSVIQSEVSVAQEVVNQMISKQFQCLHTELKASFPKTPGIFSKGKYVVSLETTCMQDIKNFKFSFEPAVYDEDYNMLRIQLDSPAGKFDKKVCWYFLTQKIGKCPSGY